jgi:hypothetical protein
MRLGNWQKIRDWQEIRRIRKKYSKIKAEDNQRDNYDVGRTQSIRNSNSDERGIASSTLDTSTIKIITDEPTLEDALDFDSYSKKLADIIRNSSPRFAIGIFGGWGTGKTSLMKMIEANVLKGDYLFNWERVPGYNNDNYNLKDYLTKNLPNLQWIESKQFVKSADEKTVSINNNNQYLSISVDKKETIFPSMSVNGKPFNNEFIAKREVEDNDNKLNVYKRDKDILTVWFNAWKYENEKYLAVVPFLRTIKITLDNDKDSKTGRSWDGVRGALENTFRAFTESTSISLGLGSYGSTQIDLSKFTDVFRADGYAKVGGESVHYHKHVTDYLEDSLSKLRQKSSNSRIVVFIDDLDRCHPKQALEVLDSIKTFFDIEGIVYVIGMDSDSINSIIEEKYGGAKDSDIKKTKKGLDYLQKIVQLPFQIPAWKESDIFNYIDKIISKGLEGSYLVEEFKKNKGLIVKAVEHNPREVKRFINNIVLAKSVITDEKEPIDKLVAVQALIYRREWQKFLELITPDEARKRFLAEYAKLKDKLKAITNDEQLNNLSKELSSAGSGLESSFKENLQIYRELIRQGDDLMNFLDPAADVLGRIEEIEKYRRAFDVVEIKTTDLKHQHDNIQFQDLSIKALESLYKEAVLSASEQTGISEKDIRNWCEEKLITPTGERSLIHYEHHKFEGMDEKVVEVLESNYLITAENQSGAKWYKLTDDRLIGPIKDSNKEYKMRKKFFS